MKVKVLTEAEWEKVFRIRCKSKRGQALSDEERDLVDRAFRQDRDRYADEEVDVFNETVPFGSSARREK